MMDKMINNEEKLGWNFFFKACIRPVTQTHADKLDKSIIKGNTGNREKLTERSGISEPRFET